MKNFENPEIQIKIFAAEDIMSASNPGGDEEQTFIKNNYTPWG